MKPRPGPETEEEVRRALRRGRALQERERVRRENVEAMVAAGAISRERARAILEERG